MPELAEVRPGEELPVDALAAWLSRRLAGAQQIEVRQFPSGHSNLTYLIRTRTPAAEYVLRRPPLGPVAPKAHDMLREYGVLQAVHPHFPLAPRPIVVCEDPSVIGAPFFVMERRRGVIARRGVPAEFAGVSDAPDRISRGLIDNLADLHAIDVRATGIVSLGKPEGFLERQVTGWTQRWRAALTEPVPAMEPVLEWLAARPPEPARATVVHQDYKLDNVMLDLRNPGRLTAVLDWEMATIGDPLADLGLTLTYWALPEARAVSGMDESAGWWSREAMVERYRERTGFDVSGLRWYEVLGTFKLAVIVQQIYARYIRGQTSDDRFQRMGQMAIALAEQGRAMLP
ncbi:MAG TPA: phosphotransferase family protein [Gemmatimonadales bacterium]